MTSESFRDLDSPVDDRHLLLVGAGPGLGIAVARRFAEGGFRVTLLARSTDGLEALADTLAENGVEIGLVTADVGDADALKTALEELYGHKGAPGLIVYNAVMGAPDTLLGSTADHLHMAYAVDVVGAVIVAQVAAPAMRAAGSGTIIATGGGFADFPIPALATVSMGKAALRSAATILAADLEADGIRVTTMTIDGQIVEGSAFDPDMIANRFWDVVHSGDPWKTEYRYSGE